MKQTIFLIILLSSLSLVFMALGENTITGAEVLIKSASSQKTSITYSSDISATDHIIFGKGDTAQDSDLKLIVPATPSSPLKEDMTFSTAGVYNIFVKPLGAGTATKQNVKQVIAAAAIGATTITKTTAADVKTDTDASVTFTVAKEMLYDGDKIIFSISSETTPSKESENNKEHVLTGVDFTKTEIAQTIKFTKAGTYNIWIQRGTTQTKQTEQTLTVSGSFVVISLAIFLGLFLF